MIAFDITMIRFTDASAAGETIDESEFQTPNHFRIGSEDPVFDRQPPFQI